MKNDDDYNMHLELIIKYFESIRKSNNEINIKLEKISIDIKDMYNRLLIIGLFIMGIMITSTIALLLK